MIKLTEHGVFLRDGKVLDSADISAAEAKKNTIAYSILNSHNTSDSDEQLMRSFPTTLRTLALFRPREPADSKSSLFPTQLQTVTTLFARLAELSMRTTTFSVSLPLKSTAEYTFPQTRVLFTPMPVRSFRAVEK